MAPQNSTLAEGVTCHNGEKKRGSSKDLPTVLEKRDVRLEESRKGDNETQDDEGSRTELIRAIEGKIREEVENLLGEMYEKLDSLENSLESEVATMKTEMKELKNELRIYQAALKSGMLAEVAAPKLKIDTPRPSKFSGSRLAQDIDNFIWGLEQYFRVMGEDNTIPFKTWKDFQFAFKEHFYPKNAQEDARAKMRQLKHDGTILEYVRKFTELKFQLPSLNEDEGYFDLKNGLQKWARLELVRREVTDTSKALIVAEFENQKSEPTKPKAKFKGDWGGDKGKLVKNGSGKPSGGNGKPHREFIRKPWEKYHDGRGFLTVRGVGNQPRPFGSSKPKWISTMPTE
ncbi:hypothetical protein GQ457_05G024170 [Hibiscus cannabinus]